MALLFTKLKVRNVEFRNRIVVSPMCQYSAKDGYANDWHLVTNGQRAIGGAGLVICEATAVVPEGRITPGCTGIWESGHVDAWKRVTTFVKAQGAAVGLQIGHAGRKASNSRPWEGDTSIPNDQGGWDTVAPSPVAFGGNIPKVPKELTVAEIHSLQDAFVAAAKRANDAGFDVLELHGAHGYLITEFLSPLSNFRKDQYGGSLENRSRFLLEIAEGVRKVWPADKPLFVRITATDWTEGGWTITDSVALSKKLKEVGVDLIDCSSGGNTPGYQGIPIGPGFQVPLASQIKREASIPTMAVGRITSGKQAEQILQEGHADLVAFATQYLRDSNLGYHFAQELGEKAPQKWLSTPVGSWLRN